MDSSSSSPSLLVGDEMSFSTTSLYSTRFSLLDAFLRQSCAEESSGEGKDVSPFPSS